MAILLKVLELRLISLKGRGHAILGNFSNDKIVRIN